MSGSACRSGVSDNLVRVEDGLRAVGQPLREVAFYVDDLVQVDNLVQANDFVQVDDLARAEDGFRAAFAVLERAVGGGGRLDDLRMVSDCVLRLRPVNILPLRFVAILCLLCLYSVIPFFCALSVSLSALCLTPRYSVIPLV